MDRKGRVTCQLYHPTTSKDAGIHFRCILHQIITNFLPFLMTSTWSRQSVSRAISQVEKRFSQKAIYGLTRLVSRSGRRTLCYFPLFFVFSHGRIRRQKKNGERDCSLKLGNKEREHHRKHRTWGYSFCTNSHEVICLDV